MSISLRNFIIFNSLFSNKEGDEAKKILFYHPSETDLDTQIKDIGLCEAILKFSGTYTKEDSCEVVRTQKTIQLYYEPEPNFWMIMTINAPYDTKQKDSIEYNEYRGDEVNEKVYRSVLKQSYRMFRLFCGTFQSHIASGEHSSDVPHELINKIKDFYVEYIRTMRLEVNNIFDIFCSTQHLPLNDLLFLRVHNFIQLIQTSFPMVVHCVLFCNEHVVCAQTSDVNPKDLHSINEYMHSTFFAKLHQSQSNLCSFARGSLADLLETTDFSGVNRVVPIIHIYNENTVRKFQLIVYRLLDAVICFLVDESTEITKEICDELFVHFKIGQQLTMITDEIIKFQQSESTPTSDKSESGPKFIFFNELSFKHSESLRLNHTQGRPKNVPVEVMNLITDLYEADIRNKRPCAKESIVKTLNDYWIVCRKSNYRHFFVIVHKNSTMLEITEEAKRLYNTHAEDVFFE
ncbi:Vacuolar fusion protein CCZ1 like [Pseudolycoriella hygida]|uniref:Vacuolar fusion protein CCZ1 like n=1 Tax=Pseudolycoriella hygida TaxID=35572 RepID=A0A9Q0S1Z7_9DIPT|nr:Vacuolar fusion protein CCZ1 like [Pseudolycoriella hygida]